jgi:hypothetical protein
MAAQENFVLLYNVKMSLNKCSIIMTVHFLVITEITIITEHNGKEHYLESTYASTMYVCNDQKNNVCI